MKSLFSVLNYAIENDVGFEEADALYRESFRYEKSFSADEAPELIEDMIFFLTDDIYPPAPDFEFGEYIECNFDPEPIATGMSRSEAISMISGGLRFVDTCNYKGEGNGIIPECLTKGMRVFVSKYNYL